MKRQRTPSRPENDNMARPLPSNDPLAPENIPKGDFIDMVTNEPVDPTRLHVFEIPQQFLDWALAKEPPDLDPDNLKDTAPRGLNVDRSKLVPPPEAIPEPEFENTPVSLGSDSRISNAPRTTSSAPATVEVASDDTNATVGMRVRRKSSWLTYWALTGRLPRRISIVLAVALGVLILILLGRHLDTQASLSPTVGETAPQGVTVPLIDAPQTHQDVGQPSSTAQSSAVRSASPSAGKVEAVPANVSTKSSTPKVTTKPDVVSAKATTDELKPSQTSPKKSTQSTATQSAPVSSANSASPSDRSPLFEPR